MAKVFQKKGSPRWYGQLTKADGKRKQIPLSEDYKASVGLLRRLQTIEDRNKALDITEESKRRSEPLGTHLDAYREHLTSKGNCEDHIDRTIRRITRVVDAKVKRIDDLDSSKIANLLARWRVSGPHRAVLYRLASFTGLGASALARISHSFGLGARFGGQVRERSELEGNLRTAIPQSP